MTSVSSRVARMLLRAASLHRTTKQVRPTRIAPPGLPGQLCHERPVLTTVQPRQCGLDFRHIAEVRHARRPATQLTGRLRPTYQQLTHNGELLRIELQRAVLRVAETVLILRDPTTEAGLLDDEVLTPQIVDSVLHDPLLQLQHRIAVALLIARIHQC